LALRGVSLVEPLLVSMAILAPLAALVGRSRGSLVAPHADTRLNVSLVVPTQVRFLVLRVRPIAFHAASRATLGPTSEASHANAVFFAKRSYHSTRILATAAHRSSTS
jgi:hypothetical protein